MARLSVLIPARNEQFLARTIDSVLTNMRGDTEVIAVADGYWPDPAIKDHPRVTLLHYSESIGQRAATNAAARVSQAEFVMKLDAHCSVDEGFDLKLMEPYDTGLLGKDVTTIPRMYNLHAFDWVCPDGHRRYQGPAGPCKECGKETRQEIVWQHRPHRKTDFARFDKALHFQYWRGAEKRRDARHTIADVMCCVGAAWMMRRDRYSELGGMDETHGSWGQMGVEVACKSWLSGGRQVVNKRTWFSHLFRTQTGFGFPYRMDPAAQEEARRYSRWLWEGGNWPLAKRPLSWLIDKFAPVPDWHTA